MKIPESMREELGRWNNGAGIGLESWISCSGNFSFAVGYAAIYCPEFIEFEDYILTAEEVSEQLVNSVRSFERQEESTPRSVEWVLNHLHIADIHCHDCDGLTVDKILFIGDKLKKIYEARLSHLFPNKPCVVAFYKPEDPHDLEQYQLSFWQKKHEN